MPHNKIEHLAKDTCRVGLTAAQELNSLVRITDAPDFEPVPAERPAETLALSSDYRGIPVLSRGERKTIEIRVSNPANELVRGMLSLAGVPEKWKVRVAPDVQHDVGVSDREGNAPAAMIDVPAGGMAAIPFVFEMDDDIRIIRERNLLIARFVVDGGTTRAAEVGAATEADEAVSGGEKSAEMTMTFGINGAQVWNVFGPFWENHVTFPHTELGEWYSAHLKADSENEYLDKMRQYHLNTKAVPENDYTSRFGELEPLEVNITEDLFAVPDLVGFQGPCTVYAERRLYSPEERTVYLLLSHTDAYEIWINGESVSSSDGADWWTAENKHIGGIKLRQGENRILLKCVADEARYSLIFTEKGTCMPQHYDFGSIVNG